MNVPAGKTACPLCGWTDISVVKTEGKRRALSCARCTLGWTYPPCDPEDYSAKFFGKDCDPKSDRRERQRLTDLPKQYQKALLLQEQTCARVAPVGGRILDIGCADGMQIERLGARGFRCQGIDPSIDAIGLAKEAGLDVVQGYFPHPQIHGPFDVVNLSHVFEHVPNPVRFLADLTDLAPGGYAVFTQCSYRGIIPRTFSGWYGWCLEGHFWHFPARSLRWLLSENGFEVQSVKQVSLTHMSRRHRYFLDYIDMVPGWSDQYVMVARIPRKPVLVSE
jgi:SAM-dependent methyltransferase